MSKKLGFLLPLLFLGLYVGLFFIILGKIPKPHDFITQLQKLYGIVGYPLIFFAAFLEALLFVGFYVPGSTVVLLGAALAKTEALYYPLVFIVGLCGLLAGYIVNYFLGKYGWHEVLARLGFEKGLVIAKKRIEKHGSKAILIGYFFPGSASLLSTAAGILRVPFKKFFLLSLLAQSFWGFLWGNLAYFFGVAAIELILKYFVFVLLIIAVIWIIRNKFYPFGILKPK